jgi:hypothetical protein
VAKHDRAKVEKKKRNAEHVAWLRTALGAKTRQEKKDAERKRRRKEVDE